MNDAQNLGAPPIPYGPYAVGEALATSRRLAGAIARKARRAADAVAESAAVQQSESTQEWIRRLEPKSAH